jgi:hypothetical protein
MLRRSVTAGEILKDACENDILILQRYKLKQEVAST